MGDGNDSGYYSFTNLEPSGTVSVDGHDYSVSGGRIWMDHQWGNWTPDGMFWDWFSLRFNDGGALMLFQFRDDQNRVSNGNWTYRSSDGRVRYGADFSVAAVRSYSVDDGETTYPLDWGLEIPSLDARFRVQPRFDTQDITDGLRIWEGLASVDGRIGDVSLAGDAFVELTGY